MKNIVYVGLGSNKGNKLEFLRRAIEKISEDKKCQFETSSSLYETKPLGKRKQENYLNAVIKISTEYSLFELLNFLKNIEKELGRVKTERWGDREIDMDILFYNDLIYSDDTITVPHKGIPSRDFVVVPLCEINSSLFHPELKQKICDINISDSEKCIIRKLQEKL